MTTCKRRKELSSTTLLSVRVTNGVVEVGLVRLLKVFLVPQDEHREGVVERDVTDVIRFVPVCVDRVYPSYVKCGSSDPATTTHLRTVIAH